MNILRFILIALFTFCFYILSPIIILAIVFPNFIFRVLVQMFKKTIRKELEQIISPLSNLFGVDNLYNSPTSTLIMGSLYEGTITREIVCHTISEKWLEKRDLNGKLMYPELQQGIGSCLGYQFWRTDSCFKVDNHVKVLETNDTFLGEEDLVKLFVKTVNEPFKEFRSPWEIFIVPNFKANRILNDEKDCSILSTLVFLKVHHTLMDGFSMMKLGQRDLGNVNTDQLSNMKSCHHVEDFGFIKKCLALFRLPFFAAKYFVDEKGLPSIINPNLLSLQRKQVVFFTIEQIDLGKIKQIRCKYNTSLTSIFLAGYAAAIRHFLQKRRKELFQQNLSLTCTVPVPLPRHPEKLRNHMSFVSVRLPVHENDSRQRLLKIHKSLDSARESLDPLSMYYALTCIGSLPSFLLRAFLQKSPASFLLSNFPGISLPLTICGHRCTDIFFNGGLLEGNIDMVCSCVGYNNSAKLTVSTDGCFVESNLEIEEFTKVIVDEFDILAK